MDDGDRSRRAVGSVSKAFQLLSAFTPAKPELGATELAALTGLDRTTIHRFVSTLLHIGVLARNPASRKYRLGLRLVDYAYTVLDSLEVRRVALPRLISLGRETGKEVSLGVLEGTDVLIIEYVRSPELLIELINQIGTRLPLHASAMGRCIMAHQPPPVLDHMLARLQFVQRTPHSLSDRQALLDRLAEIRERGYDIADRELVLGARAVGVPLRGPGGVAEAAIGLTLATATTTLEEAIEMFAPRLVAAGMDISMALGYRAYVSASAAGP